MTAPEIRTVSSIAELEAVGDLLQRVWGTSTPVVNVELSRAFVLCGGYVGAAFDATGSMIGASVGFLARHRDRPALHSHVTGLLPEARRSGVGRAMKVHQREWAAASGLEWITWTFDPLVRRNAWFNIAVLGADVHAYLPDFYGTMTDAINAGDASDRLRVEWRVAGPLPDRPREGHDAAGVIARVPTPEDVVTLRRTDPEAVGRWRAQTRTALTTALAAGGRVLGFTREGEYVIGSGR